LSLSANAAWASRTFWLSRTKSYPTPQPLAVGLKSWAGALNTPAIGQIKLREDILVIGESLHRQRYRFLWDLLFDKHPHGERIRGKWEGMGERKTDKVKARQQGLKVKQAKDKAGFWNRRRPRYLFSGLMKCGECGGGFVKISEHYFGCASARNKGTCTNLTAIKREVLEETVLGGLQDHMMDPALLEVFCAESTKHLNRLRSGRGRIERGLESRAWQDRPRDGAACRCHRRRRAGGEGQGPHDGARCAQERASKAPCRRAAASARACPSAHG
jgi:hypothetical protein